MCELENQVIIDANVQCKKEHEDALDRIDWATKEHKIITRLKKEKRANYLN